MILLNKYKSLKDVAVALQIKELKLEEIDGQLLIEGVARTGEDKTKLWDVYNQVEPNFLVNDVFINVKVSEDVTGVRAKMVMDDDFLNLHIGPGIALPVLSAIAQGEVVSLLCRGHSDWWLVRTAKGEEGYCYASDVEVVDS